MESKSNVFFDVSVMLLAIGICSFMLVTIRNDTRQKRQIKELSQKLDAIASDSDVKLGNMNMRLTEIEADVVVIKDDQSKKSEELTSKISDDLAKIKTRLNVIENKQKEQETTTEETTEQETTTEETTSEAETPYKVGAISVTLKKDTIGEIDDTKADTNPQQADVNPVPTGAHLTAAGGVFQFEGHTETYYNLDMSVVVRVAQERGIAGEYHVREDGAKMIGNYIMVAACYDVHPYGSYVNTSLGMGVVVDTGAFTAWNAGNIDIATTW